MEQDGASSFLSSSSSFSHVPIILASENLETFVNPGMDCENNHVEELKEIELQPEHCLLDEDSSIATEDVASYQHNNNEEEDAGMGQNLKVNFVIYF